MDLPRTNLRKKLFGVSAADDAKVILSTGKILCED